MLRRISTKLVVAVLLAVALPFVAFSFFINDQMANRLTRHVVQQALLGLAKDLAGQIDYFVEERRQDLDQWANAPLTHEALDDYVFERRRLERIESGETEARPLPLWRARSLASWAEGQLSAETLDLERRHRAQLSSEFDRYIELKNVYDLLLLVAEDGHLVTVSSRLPGGASPDALDERARRGLLSEAFLEYLFAQDYSRESWFQLALGSEPFVRVDHHTSRYHLEPPDADPAWDYQLGLATPVRDLLVPEKVKGVVYALVNWKFVQDLVSTPVITDSFRGLVEEDRDPSPYAWIWAADADTIIAHPDRGLYYQSIVRDVKLGQMTEAVLANHAGWGLYPEYHFKGKDKNAAFKRCKSPEQGGFGWVVGVGIDNDDIYATSEDLRTLLLGGTALVLVLAVCLMLFIARRTTGPIAELQRSARRVAEGDLDTRIEISSKDELGALAQDFNRMTRELKEQRERIIKAEKDAAWREMARQIAHDIKNPLTPISLSLDLLERARRERAEGSEEILERTMELIRRQVENLRAIAADFYEFTGGRKPIFEPVPIHRLLDEVLHLHDAWAVEQGVQVQHEGQDGIVRADAGKLRRVLVNLVSNALQAMSEGGRLFVETALEEGPTRRMRISIRDTGSGLAPEAREHLFEPYFTTKSEGTGLGLAISKRVIEEMDGTIELEPAPDGEGMVATVRLPVIEKDA